VETSLWGLYYRKNTQQPKEKEKADDLTRGDE